DLALELRSANSGTLLTSIFPNKIPHREWRAAYVLAPREPFVVVARDNTADRWFAFGAPVQMSMFSFLAWQVAKRGLLVATLAVIASLLLFGCTAAMQRKARDHAARSGA